MANNWGELQNELKERHRAENEAILARRIEKYNCVAGARVGDFLVFPDGDVRRIAHHWGERVQPSSGSKNGYGGRCYLGDGYVSYSGGLDPGIPVECLQATDETRAGWIWFFDQDIWGAGRGVDFQVEFRVFRVSGVTCNQWGTWEV